MRLRAEIGVLCALAIFAPGASHALPWPIGVSTTVPSIVAIFGQYRHSVISDCPGGTACDHFQRGISLDPTPTDAGSTVRAIVAGQVTAKTAEPLLTITASNGYSITYRYLSSSLVVGSTVSAGASLGTMSDSYLDVEMASNGTTWCNPLSPSCQGLFSNYYPPPDLHPSVAAPIILDADTGAEISLSTPIGRRHFSILSNISGTVYHPNSPDPGSVGINELGYFIEPVLITTYPSSGNSGKFDSGLSQAYQSILFTKLFNTNVPYSVSRSSEGGPYYYIATNYVQGATMASGFASNDFQDGTWNVCVRARGVLENGYTTKCSKVMFDRAAPTNTLYDGNGAQIITGASSMTVINVSGYDYFGLASISISSGTPITYPVAGKSVTQQFAGLTDGQYTATVVDLAGNSTSNSFTIDTSNPSGSALNPDGGPYDPSGPNALVIPASAPSGVKSIEISGPSLDYAEYFNCPTSAKIGIFQLSTPGTYTITRTNCAEVAVSTDMPVSTAAVTAVMTGVGMTLTHSATIYPDIDALTMGTSTITVTSGLCTIPQSDAPVACLQMHVSAQGESSGCSWVCDPGCCYIRWEFYNQGLSAESFSITNTTDTPIAYGISPHITLAVSKVGGVNGVSGSISFPQSEIESKDDSISVTIDATPVGQPKPNDNPPAHSSSTYQGITISSCAPADNLLQQLLAQLLASVLPGKNPYCWAGSEAVFTSSVPMNFSFQEPDGVVIDTTTLGIYGYDETSSQWTREAVANQEVSISSTGYIIASGSFTRTGTFGVYFMGHDSSAPVTTFDIQGSSSVFGETLLVSTDSFVVLTATDPVVDGFASTVETITYCIDPSSGSVFSVYTDSVPLPLGVHVFQYRSYDYAGNAEEIKTATFTVTAGSVFRATSDDQALGGLLVGFLGSGAEAEVVARAQDSTTLLVSSANLDAMLGVTNIGSVGVGVADPQAQLDIGRAAVALQLRSGDIVSTGTSVQAAFGYNGDVAMRHAIRTVHGAATEDNRMDFLVWSPDAGSTTTIAARDVMSLQGSTIAHSGAMHVLPVGTPDVELEVSNGVTTGGGTMQRLQVLTPSSRRFKSDIRYLKEKDEDRALDETAKLNHVRFRYKSRAKDGRLADDPSQQVRTGLVYEEAPAVLKDGKGAVLTNERLASVELALRSAMRRLEALEKRYAALKARRKKP